MIIDTNIYLTYVKNQKLYRLLNAIAAYSLKVYVNDRLIEEIKRNLPKFIKSNYENIAKLTMELISDATIHVNTVSVFTKSPDPKDNFLFDIALQTNSPIIVTQEKALLQFADSPVPIKDLKWFKETYPVPL